MDFAKIKEYELCQLQIRLAMPLFSTPLPPPPELNFPTTVPFPNFDGFIILVCCDSGYRIILITIIFISSICIHSENHLHFVFNQYFKILACFQIKPHG